MLLLLAHLALAAPQDLGRDYSTAPSPAALAADLVGDKPLERRFAARELRRQAVVARRLDAREYKDALREQETSMAYRDLRADVGPAALRAVVEHADVRAACADILAALRIRDALPTLRSLAEREPRKGVERHLERAVASLEGS